MPTYVYECRHCQRVFETEQRMTDAPLTDCGCGAQQSLIRLMQPPAVMFKGAGFYVNDSARPAEAKAEPACSGEPASCPACAPPSDD